MKRVIALSLTCCLLLSACGQPADSEAASDLKPASVPKSTSTAETVSDVETVPPVDGPAVSPDNIPTSDEPAPTETASEVPIDLQPVVPEFRDLSDPHLLQYVEDDLYANLVDEFSSEDYIIENVNAIYYSKEYLEEVAYNSKANIFFGYTLAELDEQFQGERYVFTLGDDGKTTVQLFEDYDDTYNRVIKNVAIGTGIILICVTASVISGGAGASTVSMIFAASAKTGTTFALSSAAFSGIFSGAVTGIQTKDFDQAVNAAALAGSESFKWGAISGALIGGASKLYAIHHPRPAEEPLLIGDPDDEDAISAWRESELRVLDKYGGEEQRTFLDRKEVPFGTPGATRPDVVRTIDNHLEAIEVKNYNLANPNNLNTLCHELERQVSNRIVNCPSGTTQRVVLDVSNRSFSPGVIDNAVQTIETRLFNIYPNIPIDIFGI